MRIMILGLLVFFAASCQGGTKRPYASYIADIKDESQIVAVAGRIREIADMRGFDLVEKPTDQMRYLTQGHSAIFVSLYFEGDPIVVVTNVGVGGKLVVSVTDFRKMPSEELDSLTAYIVGQLEALGLEFERQ